MDKEKNSLMSIWNLIFKAFQEKWPKFSRASNHTIVVAIFHQMDIQLWEWNFVQGCIYQSILCAKMWSGQQIQILSTVGLQFVEN